MSSADTTSPTPLQQLRRAIKKLLTDAEIWPEDAVITEQETDVWHQVGMASAVATHGCACIIEDVQGDGTSEDDLEMDLTIAVTTVGQVNTTPGEESEEKLWDKTVRKLTNARPVYAGVSDDWSNRLRFQGFAKASEIIPDRALEAVQFARQTTFKIRFCLKPGQ